MKCNFIIKILLLLIFVSLSGCNSTKKVPEGSFLLRKNDISINNKKPKTHHVYSYLRQEPNSRILGIPLGLLIYNLADDHAEENYQKWLKKQKNHSLHTHTNYGTLFLRGSTQIHSF